MTNLTPVRMVKRRPLLVGYLLGIGLIEVVLLVVSRLHGI